MTMSQSALKADLRKIHPAITFRVRDGEFRVSVNPHWLADVHNMTYPQAREVAENVAIYDTFDRADSDRADNVLAAAINMHQHVILNPVR